MLNIIVVMNTTVAVVLFIHWQYESLASFINNTFLQEVPESRHWNGEQTDHVPRRNDLLQG
jgi:hypothetical protein